MESNSKELNNLYQRLDLKEFLDSFIEKHGSFSISWDGGNDEGSFFINSSDGQLHYYESPELSRLVQIVAEKIGYGSFAGDFHAYGEVSYDKEKKILKGEDSYTCSDHKTLTFDKDIPVIRLEIPEHLWFEKVSISTRMEEDLDFNFTIEGPVSEMHIDFEEYIKDHLTKEYKERLYLYSKHKSEYRDLYFGWDEIEYQFNDFKLDKKKKVRYVDIKSMSVSFEEESESVVIIEL